MENLLVESAQDAAPLSFFFFLRPLFNDPSGNILGPACHARLVIDPN